MEKLPNVEYLFASLTDYSFNLNISFMNKLFVFIVGYGGFYCLIGTGKFLLLHPCGNIQIE